MNQQRGEWEKVGVLLERQSNLNQLRVGTIQVYLVVVAAVLALLGGGEISEASNSIVIPLGICLVGVGVLVLLYDIRLRARAHAVAAEVARSIPNNQTVLTDPKALSLDEDLLFSMILMLMNSTLIYIGIELGFILGDVHSLIAALIAITFFAAQIAFYAWYWPRLAQNLSAWPDSLSSERESE